MNQRVEKAVLTIGPKYLPPRGGIAQTLYFYEKFIFSKFNYVANSCDGSILAKVWCLIAAITKCTIKLLFDRKIKIVHIHSASNFSFRRSVWFLELAKLFGKKVIMHIHGGGFEKYYNTKPECIAKQLNKADCVVALSKQWNDFFSMQVGIKRVVTINNVVPKATIIPQRKQTPLHVLYLGLINEKKGVYDLIEAIGSHASVFVGNVVVHLAGKGNENDISRMDELIVRYCLQQTVVFEGWVAGDQKNSLLEESSVFILPSYYEGLPISILEAMAAGMAILATKVGGIPSIVTEGENGLLFEPGDIEQIADSLEQLLLNRQLRCAMGEKSLQMITQFFPDAVENQLENLYRQILSTNYDSKKN